MCGEKAALPPGVLAPPGSPPRMRGKELAVGVIRQHGGITPAHAGKSEESQMMHYLLRDHPRTCGEKIDETTNTNEATGSPPHMRGKVVVVVVGPVETGITPAHAGKSASAALSPASPRDHPRTCGEKAFLEQTRQAGLGSPPHMRGKVKRHSKGRQCGGITPAHAGKRRENEPARSLSQDHPRTCGEKRKAQTFLSWRKGSPPHMRGKAPAQRWTILPPGITPAHAGKRLSLAYRFGALQDHPRTCGEKPSRTYKETRFSGSPPHMRGKVVADGLLVVLLGITPAHAGKSAMFYIHLRWKWDHPRMCGEKTKKIP